MARGRVPRESERCREAYHELLLRVQAACLGDAGLEFVEQASWLLRTWLAYHSHEVDDVLEGVEVPVRTPAAAIWGKVKVVVRDPLAAPAAEVASSQRRQRSGNGYQVSSDAPPPRKVGRAVRGPGVDVLLSLKVGEHLRLDLKHVGLKSSAMSLRVGRANDECRASSSNRHFVGYVAADDSYVVCCRQGGPPAKRSRRRAAAPG